MKITKSVPISSSPQWLCGDILTMDDQWHSSRIVRARTNRLLSKNQAGSVNILIKQSLVHDTQSAQQAKARSIIHKE